MMITVSCRASLVLKQSLHYILSPSHTYLRLSFQWFRGNIICITYNNALLYEYLYSLQVMTIQGINTHTQLDTGKLF